MMYIEVDLGNGPVDDAVEVAAYLNACPVLVVAAGLDPDPLAAGAPPAVPIGTASDGVYAWPLAVGYFLAVHGVAPDEQLLAHIRSRNYTPPDITPNELARLRDELAAASIQTAGNAANEIYDAAADASGSWGERPPA